MTASTGSSALVGLLETMEEDLAIRLIPAGMTLMLLQVSKTMRSAMQRVSPPAMIKVKRGHQPESLKNAMLNIMKWCRITAIDLFNAHIQDDGVGRLAAVLGQCVCLARLNLSANKFGDEGAGRLATVLGQCASLAHLDLRWNWIGVEGAGRLAAVLGQCASLVHLDLRNNRIEAEGAWRLAAVLGQCASLSHLDLRWNEFGDEAVWRLMSVAKRCPSVSITFNRC